MRKFLYPLFFVACALYFTPQILSTQWGNDRVAAYLQRHLGGEVTIQSLSFNWGKVQSCHEVVWKRPEKRIESRIEKLTIRSSLYDLLTYKSSHIEILFEGAAVSSPTKIGVLKKKKPLQLEIGNGSALVQNGVIALPSTLMMLNQKHLILLEGNVNLTQNLIDLQVGVPAETLKGMFGLKNLPEDFLLEIPIACNMSAKALEKKLIAAFLKNYAKVTSLQR